LVVGPEAEPLEPIHVRQLVLLEPRRIVGVVGHRRVAGHFMPGTAMALSSVVEAELPARVHPVSVILSGAGPAVGEAACRMRFKDFWRS
jgi:hypothetical protein